MGWKTLSSTGIFNFHQKSLKKTSPRQFSSMAAEMLFHPL